MFFNIKIKYKFCLKYDNSYGVKQTLSKVCY